MFGGAPALYGVIWILVSQILGSHASLAQCDPTDAGQAAYDAGWCCFFEDSDLPCPKDAVEIGEAAVVAAGREDDSATLSIHGVTRLTPTGLGNRRSASGSLLAEIRRRERRSKGPTRRQVPLEAESGKLPDCEGEMYDYKRGACCFYDRQDMDCPYEHSKVASFNQQSSSEEHVTTTPGHTSQTSATPSTATEATGTESISTPAEPTFLTTSVTGKDGAPTRAVLLSGGAITSAITLPGSPVQSALDMGGGKFRSSVAQIYSDVESSVIPKATAYMSDVADPTKVSAAAQAVETVVARIGALTKDQFLGEAVFRCSEKKTDGFKGTQPDKKPDAEPDTEPGPDSNLAETIVLEKLRDLNCRLLDTLRNLNDGGSPQVLKSVGEDVDELGALIFAGPPTSSGQTTSRTGVTFTSLTSARDQPSESTPTPSTSTSQFTSTSQTPGSGDPESPMPGADLSSVQTPAAAGGQPLRSTPMLSTSTSQFTDTSKTTDTSQLTNPSRTPGADLSSAHTPAPVGGQPSGTGDGADIAASTVYITELPPDATMISVTDHVTENKMVTTTLDGHDGPVAVPLIAPVPGGPGYLCAQCVPSINGGSGGGGPCVDLLGLMKVGSCGRRESSPAVGAGGPGAIGGGISGGGGGGRSGGGSSGGGVPGGGISGGGSSGGGSSGGGSSPDGDVPPENPPDNSNSNSAANSRAISAGPTSVSATEASSESTTDSTSETSTESSSDSTSESTTETSSECSESQTVTVSTVFVAATADSASGSPQDGDAEPVSSIVTHESIAPCGLSLSATTITVTETTEATPTPEATPDACEMDDEVPEGKDEARPGSLTIMKREDISQIKWPNNVPQPKTFPPAYNWLDEHNYIARIGSSPRNRWFRSIAWLAYRVATTHVHISLPSKPVGQSAIGTANSQYMLWGKEAKNFLVMELNGDTAVVVVSRRGIWAARFWANEPLWGVTEALGSGRRTENVMEYGLQHFIKNPSHTKGLKVGTMLNAEHQPKIFIISRRPRDSIDKLQISRDPAYGDPPPDVFGDVDLINKIREALNTGFTERDSPILDWREKWPRIEVRYVALPKDDPTTPEPIAKNAGPIDLNSLDFIKYCGKKKSLRLRDPAMGKVRGKFVVQYQPGVVKLERSGGTICQTDERAAEWRPISEGKDIPVEGNANRWYGAPHQLYYEKNGDIQRAADENAAQIDRPYDEERDEITQAQLRAIFEGLSDGNDSPPAGLSPDVQIPQAQVEAISEQIPAEGMTQPDFEQWFMAEVEANAQLSFSPAQRDAVFDRVRAITEPPDDPMDLDHLDNTWDPLDDGALVTDEQLADVYGTVRRPSTCSGPGSSGSAHDPCADPEPNPVPEPMDLVSSPPLPPQKLIPGWPEDSSKVPLFVPKPAREPPADSWWSADQFDPGSTWPLVKALDRWFRAMVWAAFRDPRFNVPMTWPQSATKSQATSQWVFWEESVVSLVIGELWGDTGILVVSRKGAWAARLWQDQPDWGVEDALGFGKFGENEKEFGLQNFIGNDNFIVDDGDDDHPKGREMGKEIGHMFDNKHKPIMFIFTRRPRDAKPDFGVTQKDRAFAPGREDAIGDEKVMRKIGETLKKFADQRKEKNPTAFEPWQAGPKIIKYIAAPDTDPDQDEILKPLGPLDISRQWSYRSRGCKLTLRDKGCSTPRGKVLLQYQPGLLSFETTDDSLCYEERAAGWRMFHEAKGPLATDRWIASSRQKKIVEGVLERPPDENFDTIDNPYADVEISAAGQRRQVGDTHVSGVSDEDEKRKNAPRCSSGGQALTCERGSGKPLEPRQVEDGQVCSISSEEPTPTKTPTTASESSISDSGKRTSHATETPNAVGRTSRRPPTASSPTPEAEPTASGIACLEAKDCPPALCAGGMAILSCTNKKCTCASPQGPKPESCKGDDASSCKRKCDKGFWTVCDGGTCECRKEGTCSKNGDCRGHKCAADEYGICGDDSGQCGCAPTLITCTEEKDCKDLRCPHDGSPFCADGNAGNGYRLCACPKVEGDRCSRMSDCDSLLCRKGYTQECNDKAKCECVKAVVCPADYDKKCAEDGSKCKCEKKPAPPAPPAPAPSPITKYGAAFAGIDTNPDHWFCMYHQRNFNGHDPDFDFCGCRWVGNVMGGSACDGCDDMVELPVNKFSCGEGYDKSNPNCHTCRPWEYICMDSSTNSCKPKEWDSCKQCHRIEIGNAPVVLSGPEWEKMTGLKVPDS